MAGFGDEILNAIVKESTYEKIGSYIFICCEEMKNDLYALEKKLPNDENKIRNHLLENYLDDNYCRRKHNMMMFHFDSEIPEKYNEEALTYDGRVDIRIVSQNEWFGNREAIYFVECKRIDGKNRLNNEYVLNGIKRFVVSPPHYSSYYRKNYMLGFVVRKIEIEDNIKKIDLIQQLDKEIDIICNLLPKSTKKFYTYTCKYNMDEKVIELMHIFTDFSSVMSKTNN